MNTGTTLLCTRIRVTHNWTPVYGFRRFSFDLTLTPPPLPAPHDPTGAFMYTVTYSVGIHAKVLLKYTLEVQHVERYNIILNKLQLYSTM